MSEPLDSPEYAEKRARAMDKIKKCIALAQSSNPHESEAAMRQARKLMEKYRLEISDVHATEAEELQEQTVEVAANVIAHGSQCVRLHRGL